MDWRSPRSSRLVAAALFVVAACVVVTRIDSAFVAVNSGPVEPNRVALASLVASFFAALAANVLVVFAWYGFVAKRLARRLSPLVVGLSIGLGLALPTQLAFWLDATLAGGAYSWGRPVALAVGSILALGVLGVWLACRCRGLLPTVVLFTAYGAGASLAAWTNSVARRERAWTLYPVTVMIAAVLFAVAGRMWRRPETAPTPPALDGSRPPTDHPYALTR